MKKPLHLIGTVLRKISRRISYPEIEPYSTHQQALIYAVMNSGYNRPIVECGCGWYSTPILHEICSSIPRQLITTDYDIKWLTDIIDSINCLSSNRFHSYRQVNDWSKFADEMGEASVVFIDSSPIESRRTLLDKFVKKCEYVVVHDAGDKIYNLDLHRFENVIYYDSFKPITAIVKGDL